jgi:hypothetical protein
VHKTQDGGTVLAYTTLWQEAAEVVSIDPTAWYRKVYRWGQTNLTEVDPIRYDVGWWRETGGGPAFRA